MRSFRFRLVFILTRAKSLWSKALFLWWRLANDRPSPDFGPESWLAPNDYLRDFKCSRRCNWFPRIATSRGYTVSWQAINKPCMVDFVMAEVEAPKSFERAIQESIEKVLETFDGVENLSAEQSDTICNFILRKDLLAMLPTGFGKTLLFQLIPGLCVDRWCLAIENSYLSSLQVPVHVITVWFI